MIFFHLENAIPAMILFLLLFLFAVFILFLAIYIVYKALNPAKVEEEYHLFKSEDE